MKIHSHFYLLGSLSCFFFLLVSCSLSDELDKISTSTHGEEVANFLIHLTDFTQNSKYQDKYFGDIDLDMSKCIFIFSYNHIENVNPILRDRMITIHAKSYTASEKIKLAKDYILPKIYKATQTQTRLALCNSTKFENLS